MKKKNEILLIDSNFVEWRNLCKVLNASDDELFQIFLNFYSSQCGVPLHKYSSAILNRLNNQRIASSHHCDFFYQPLGAAPDSFSSAHACVIETYLSENFLQYLGLLTQNTNFVSDDGRPSTFQLDDKTIVRVPLGFQNIVQYCYTGDYSLIGENLPNITEIRWLIEQLVKDQEIKFQMQADLDNLPEATEQAPVSVVIEESALAPSSVGQSESDVTEDRSSDCASQSCDDDKNSFHESANDPSDSDDSIEEAATDDNTINIVISSNSRASSLQYKCSECDDAFATRAELAKHLRNDHAQMKQRNISSRAGRQRKVVQWSFFQSKKSKMDGMVAECCGEEFCNKFQLGLHILYKHSAAYANCTECGELVLLQDLTSHYQTQHNFSEPNNPVVVTSEPARNELAVTNRVTSVHQAVLGSEADNIFSPATISSANAGEMYNFVDLNTIKNDDTLTTKQNVWDGNRKCVNCQKEFTITSYIDHLNKQYEVSHSRSLSASDSMHKNFRCVLFQCLLCHKSKASSNEKGMRLYLLLKSHVDRYHLPESSKNEKIPCDECGAIVMKYYLREHKRKHKEGSSSSEKVPCDVCGKSVTKGRITVHRRTHFEKYPCPHCAKEFNRKENLRVHERIHTGEKPFVCDVCGKGFRQNVELRLHNRKHEKEKAAQMQEPINYIDQTTTFFVQHADMVG